MAPEGLFKACPPAACTIARPDLPARLWTPADLRSTPVRGRGFAAYLPGYARQLLSIRCLLAGLRPSTPQHSLRSLRRRGFAHYVRRRHYRSSLLAAASNALTFVRGADRACCAPRKGRRGITYVPRKWSWRPTKACLHQPPRDPERCRAHTRQRHLAARTPPKGHWRTYSAAAPCRLLNILCSMRNVTRPGPFPRS